MGNITINQVGNTGVIMLYLNGHNRNSVMEQIKKYNTGKRAYDESVNQMSGNGCVYETEKGNRCAVGCFIPDGHSALSYIGGASQLLDEYPELAELMPMDTDDLVKLQSEHDSFKNDGHLTLHEVLEQKLIALENQF